MKTPSILIADDDGTMRGYLSHFLSSCGYQTECVDSGDNAIARLRQMPAPDLVLLDMLMPGTDGIDVLTHLKKVSPAIPVVVLSGVGHVRTVVDAIKLGAADYLAKPFEDEELELTIRNILERLRLRDEVQSLRRQLADSDDQELGIGSENLKMVRIREIARQVAD